MKRTLSRHTEFISVSEIPNQVRDDEQRLAAKGILFTKKQKLFCSAMGMKQFILHFHSTNKGQMDYADTSIEERELEIPEKDFEKHIALLEKQMKKAAEDLDFETAIRLRDELSQLRRQKVGV